MTSKRILVATTVFVASALAFVPAHAAGQIKGWWTNQTQDYDFGVEHVDGALSEKCAFIKKIASAPNGYGTLSQGISAEQYRGKHVRLSAMLKSKDADGVQLFLRMDGPEEKVLAFRNMDDAPVKGTTDWKHYDIVLDVPQQAQAISYGYYLLGKGEAWADSFKIEVVGNDVPVSTPEPNLPDKPVNGDFEQ